MERQLTTRDLTRAVLLAMAGALPLVLFAVALLTLLERQQDTALRDRLRRGTENYALAMEQTIQSELELLAGLGGSTTLDDGRIEDFGREAARLRDSNAEWFNIVLADTEKQLFNLRYPELQPLRNPTNVAAVFATARPVVGSVELGRVGMWTPIIRDGAVRYSLAAALTLESFTPGSQQFRLPAGWVGTVVDANGVIVNRSADMETYAGQPLASVPQAAAGQTGYEQRMPIGDIGWQVVMAVTGTAMEQAYRPIRTLVWSGAGVAIGLTLLLSVAIMNGWAGRREASVLIAANDRLRAERDRARLYFEAAANILVVIGTDRLVQMINRKGAEILGRPEADIVGRDWCEAFVPADHHAQFDALLRTANDTTEALEYPLLRADGTMRLITWHSSVIRTDAGEVVGVLSSGEDVTDRRRADERVRQLQEELLHASRVTEMGQMAAALAHEVNQPLAAVSNYLGAARAVVRAKELDATRVERLREVIERIHLQVTRAADIVRRLRAFIAKRDVEHRVENIRDVLEEALALALVGAPQRSIMVHRTIETSARVLLDRIQIQQVVVNLVRNAVEAMESAPRKELTIRVVEADGMVEISISDTGTGIAPEIAERLFQPFASTKRQGMGIGLSVCRTIVQAHGGSIRAANRSEGGTQFVVTLPIVLAAAPIA